MMAGVVNARLEAVIRLTVRGPSGRVRRVRAVIDTGFNGYLSLRPATIAELGLVWKQTDKATLADGSQTEFEVFTGVVVWDRRKCAIFVDEADTTPLVGTALLAEYRLTTDFRPGGKVLIRRLRPDR